MTLRVALVIPDRELWSGEARTVIAKTTEGDIGVLTGHSPVFGILAEGSLVEILTEESSVKAAFELGCIEGYKRVGKITHTWQILSSGKLAIERKWPIASRVAIDDWP